MAPMRKAAASYTKENSILRRWIEERNMVEREDLDIDTTEAFRMFHAYAKEQDDRSALRWKLSDFKDALKKACPSIRYDNRTTNSHPNRAYIRGFGQLPIEFNEGEQPNVVPFPKTQEK